MNRIRPQSDRTRRRKIAAEVLRLVAETQASAAVISNNDFFGNSIANQTQFVEANNINQSVECNFDEVASVEVAANENMEAMAGPNDSISSVEWDCILESPNSNLDEIEFVEKSDWITRNIDDSEDDDSSDEKSGSNTCNRLGDWSVRHDISLNALSELLKILQPMIPELPRDARTLLHTPRNVAVSSVAGGEYYYFGLTHWLSKVLSRLPPNHSIQQLTVHINIDGIPLFNSSTTSLWPILGSVHEIEGSIFPVAVYCNK